MALLSCWSGPDSVCSHVILMMGMGEKGRRILLQHWESNLSTPAGQPRLVLKDAAPPERRCWRHCPRGIAAMGIRCLPGPPPQLWLPNHHVALSWHCLAVCIWIALPSICHPSVHDTHTRLLCLPCNIHHLLAIDLSAKAWKCAIPEGFVSHL